jgi:hypothetical protein
VGAVLSLCSLRTLNLPFSAVGGGGVGCAGGTRELQLDYLSIRGGGDNSNISLTT